MEERNAGQSECIVQQVEREGRNQAREDHHLSAVVGHLAVELCPFGSGQFCRHPVAGHIARHQECQGSADGRDPPPRAASPGRVRPGLAAPDRVSCIVRTDCFRRGATGPWHPQHRSRRQYNRECLTSRERRTPSGACRTRCSLKWLRRSAFEVQSG